MSVMLMSEDWRSSAECLHVDPEMMFPNTPSEFQAAREVCSRCPVQVECLSDAIEFARGQGRNREAIYGVWGGLSGAEIRFLAWESRGSARRVAERGVAERGAGHAASTP